MIKIKYFLLAICLVGCLAACKKTPVDTFDNEAQFRIDTANIRKFVNENNLSVTKDPESGIFYQVIAPGSGSVQYTGATNIIANYTGRRLDGSEFETTTGKAPATFPLGGVIVGWQFGIQKIQKGGKIRLLIPSFYAYGNRGQGPIEPNTVLDFDIELVDVK